ncbi:MAG: hypothetical protein KKA61_01255 [Nanoarchaeota archaeon]|nr:hypothetical protein [Nanoarchaeota archaeon]MBU4492975.1 hypothetical protein [Nanoarchaeota archaeon]
MREKDKERVIATKVSANIFGQAQLIDMKIHGDWKKGNLKDLLEKALNLYTQVGEKYIKKEKLPENFIELFISGGIKTVEEEIKNKILEETSKAKKEK